MLDFMGLLEKIVSKSKLLAAQIYHYYYVLMKFINAYSI